ncbi:MAG: hypothetical protein ACR2P8_07870 [Myxococcota bacterium]
MTVRPESPTRREVSPRRYLVQLVLVFALTGAVLVPGYIEIFPQYVFSETYGRWRAQLDFIAEPGPDPEILIAGDSRVQAAILPARLGPEARSIALGGATAIETYYLFRRYLEHHAPPRVLLVSVSPFHMEKVDVFWNWTIKWKALRAPEALELFRRAEALDDRVLGEPDARELSLRWARLRLNTIVDYAPELRKTFPSRRARSRQANALVVAAQGHSYYGEEVTCSEPNQEVWDKDGFQASPLLDAYLQDTLALAARHGVRVVLAAMPMNHSSWQAIEPEYFADYHQHVARLAAQRPQVEVRAFLWTLPDDHFGDASHVNERGALLVTDWLAPLL